MKFRTKSNYRLFSNAALWLWKQLPEYTRTLKTLACFSKSLKTSLFIKPLIDDTDIPQTHKLPLNILLESHFNTLYGILVSRNLTLFSSKHQHF